MSDRGLAKIRELLGIPEELRTYPIRDRKREHMARLKNKAHADAWAKQRAAELTTHGIQAVARRVRKHEPLCVCYKLPAATATTVAAGTIVERVAAHA
ncbi:MAG: hypothetical protein ACPLRH_04190 [Desulfotomaculales bacterium]